MRKLSNMARRINLVKINWQHAGWPRVYAENVRKMA
jgi:hypothetical protein